MRVQHVLPGPAGHGVVRHGLAVARLQRAAGVEVTVVEELAGARPAADVTHVQFSDSLFTGDVARSAAALVAWSRTAPRPLVVTLHDVPGHDPDRDRDRRRRAAYRSVAAVSDAVVVSAPHELAGAGPGAVVVPLPVEPLPPAGPRPNWADRPTVGVLGFVYPGKGHADVLDALAGTGTRVVVLGAASPGHEPLLADLRERARDRGVDLVVTGPLSEADLHAGARAVTVPVAAYRTLGASGSLATWAACGRCPVVTPSRLVLDQVRDRPGGLIVTDDLRATVRAALRAPGGTWLAGPAERPDVVAQHLAVYRSCRP